MTRHDSAGLPSAVTDTHARLVHAASGRALGKLALAHVGRCERRDAITYIPPVVVWECSLLARAVRINLHRSVSDFFADQFSNPAYQPFDLTLSRCAWRTNSESAAMRSMPSSARRRACWICRF